MKITFLKHFHVYKMKFTFFESFSCLQNEKNTFLKRFSCLQNQNHVFEANLFSQKWKLRFWSDFHVYKMKFTFSERFLCLQNEKKHVFEAFSSYLQNKKKFELFFNFLTFSFHIFNPICPIDYIFCKWCSGGLIPIRDWMIRDSSI